MRSDVVPPHPAILLDLDKTLVNLEDHVDHCAALRDALAVAGAAGPVEVPETHWGRCALEAMRFLVMGCACGSLLLRLPSRGTPGTSGAQRRDAEEVFAMEQGPGTGGAPAGPSGSPARPGIVTAAAVLLFVGGGLGALGGLLAVTGGGFLGGAFGGIAIVLGLVMLAVGALEIYAGVQVLALKEQGRVIGLALAAIGALLSLLQIGAAPGSAIIGLAINGFVIYALVTTASAFHR